MWFGIIESLNNSLVVLGLNLISVIILKFLFDGSLFSIDEPFQKRRQYDLQINNTGW
jgi:hypothetical protein